MKKLNESGDDVDSAGASQSSSFLGVLGLKHWSQHYWRLYSPGNMPA